MQNDKGQTTGTGITLFRYTWDGWGIDSKYLKSCNLVDRILAALDAMEGTDKTEPKISDDVLETGPVGGRLPVKPGTLWIEAGDKIYRMTSDLLQICLVETHFGEGEILKLPEGFSIDVNAAWNYAPYDYYLGTYNPGDDTVVLTNVYAADSSVRIHVKKIEMNPDSTNKITLEVVSTKAQEIRIDLLSQQSADFFGVSDAEVVVMEKGIPKTVELEFGMGIKYHYRVNIQADNTRISITINPQEQN